MPKRGDIGETRIDIIADWHEGNLAPGMIRVHVYGYVSYDDIFGMRDGFSGEFYDLQEAFQIPGRSHYQDITLLDADRLRQEFRGHGIFPMALQQFLESLKWKSRP